MCHAEKEGPDINASSENKEVYIHIEERTENGGEAERHTECCVVSRLTICLCLSC